MILQTKKILISSFLFFACLVSYGQQQGTIKYLKMPCKMLQGVTERDYTLYLPPGYDVNESERYPVLYLLHGGGCSNTDWARFGNLKQVADSLIGRHEVPSMIVVCAEGNKNNMIWFNAEHWTYEDFFFKEFVPYIQNQYRTYTDKQHRSLAGFSMGGGASIVYGVHHPELFNMVYGMSSYLRRQPLEFLKTDPSGEWRQQVVEENNPIKTVNASSAQDAERLNTVRWFLDCGDDDFTLDANIDMVRAFKSHGIQVQFRVKDVNHNWDYWRPALVEAIKNAFAGN